MRRGTDPDPAEVTSPDHTAAPDVFMPMDQRPAMHHPRPRTGPTGPAQMMVPEVLSPSELPFRKTAGTQIMPCRAQRDRVRSPPPAPPQCRGPVFSDGQWPARQPHRNLPAFSSAKTSLIWSATSFFSSSRRSILSTKARSLSPVTRSVSLICPVSPLICRLPQPVLPSIWGTSSRRDQPPIGLCDPRDVPDRDDLASPPRSARPQTSCSPYLPGPSNASCDSPSTHCCSVTHCFVTHTTLWRSDLSPRAFAPAITSFNDLCPNSRRRAARRVRRTGAACLR